MNKKFAQTALAVVLGICVTITVFAAFSLLFDAIFSKDIGVVSSPSKDMEKAIGFIRNTSIGVVCFSVATLACYCFAYLSQNKKAFACLSAGAGLVLAISCIAFVFVLRAFALENGLDAVYAAATAYFSELLPLAAASLLLCVYFTISAVRAFKEQVRPETQVGEERDNEEN